MENLNFQFRIKTNEEKAFIAFVGNRSLRDNQYFLVKVRVQTKRQLYLKTWPAQIGRLCLFDRLSCISLYIGCIKVMLNKLVKDNGRSNFYQTDLRCLLDVAREYQ